MTIEQNIALKPYNTFGINAVAKHFVSVKTPVELYEVLNLKTFPNPFILGGGSNILLTKNIDNLVLHVNIKGIQVFDETENTVLVTANAGENWHEFVLWTLSKGYGGLENLSLIPGNVGSAPIQNIGAYGVELKDTFVSCNTIQKSDLSLKTYTKEDCYFDYRSSIFKTSEKNKQVIMSVTFRLTKTNHSLKWNYGAIKDELEQAHLKPTIKSISDAVIKIRKSKLPDPKLIGNSGSFFKNPVLTKKQYLELKLEFPDMPNYPINEELVKVPAGWLIEEIGFKGKTFGHYGVHKKQALVLVNYTNANGTEILNLSRLIQEAVSRLFNIDLEAEVNII